MTRITRNIAKIFVCVLLGVLFYYALSNLIMGADMIYANNMGNIKILLTKNPNLPICKIVVSILNLQSFNQINLSSIFAAFAYFFGGIGILGAIYILMHLIQTILVYNFNDDYIKLSFLVVAISNIVFFIQVIVSAIAAVQVFFNNAINPYEVLKGYGIYYIVVGAVVMLLVLATIFVIIRSIIKDH